MAAYIFDNILTKAATSGIGTIRSREARKWFRDVAKNTKVNPTRLVSENSSMHSNITMPGKMYSFFYDPKHKKTLPYYDTFPIIFLMDIADKGFYGMNLHYLPPVLRAKMMDALYPYVSNKKFDERTRMKLSYEAMKTASKFKLFQPTIKRYLTSHVKSTFLEIPADKWEIAAFLPTARFKKASNKKVWGDSSMAINN